MAKMYPIKISKKIQETHDSISLIFDIPEEYKSIFLYSSAQFLTFQLNINEKKYLRSYSLSSCPLLNEPLQTTVKRVKEGVVSNYMIDHLKEGDTILSRKPAGRFFKPPGDLKAKHYYLFAAGSGITPMFSIIKTVLSCDKNNQITLFYANRNEHSIIYKKELKNWSDRFPVFKIIHILSQAQQSNSCDIQGRLNEKHLKKYLNLKKTHELFYLCGPEGFMQTIENFLTMQSIAKTQIHKESFFSSISKKDTSQKQTEIKTTSSVSACSKDTVSVEEQSITVCANEYLNKQAPNFIEALINNEKIKISAQPDIPILEQLLSAGYSPPFSCLSGNCMSCLAVLKKGRITQDERGILEDDNITNKEILTCQAKPESLHVEVDYDNI